MIKYFDLLIFTPSATSTRSTTFPAWAPPPRRMTAETSNVNNSSSVPPTLSSSAGPARVTATSSSTKTTSTTSRASGPARFTPSPMTASNMSSLTGCRTGCTKVRGIQYSIIPLGLKKAVRMVSLQNYSLQWHGIKTHETYRVSFSILFVSKQDSGAFRDNSGLMHTAV